MQFFWQTDSKKEKTTTIADVLRRANFQCDLVSIEGEYVAGAHDMVLKADVVMNSDPDQLKDYDMIIFPGGWAGVSTLSSNDRIIHLAQYYDSNPDKYVAAMCAAPSILAKAGITKGRSLTAYPDPKLDLLFGDANYLQDAVVIDEKLITSRGPATALPFAFALVDVLGGNSEVIKARFLYDLLKEWPDGSKQLTGGA